jgi:chromosome segregation ATPase
VNKEFNRILALEDEARSLRRDLEREQADRRAIEKRLRLVEERLVQAESDVKDAHDRAENVEDRVERLEERVEELERAEELPDEDEFGEAGA